MAGSSPAPPAFTALRGTAPPAFTSPRATAPRGALIVRCTDRGTPWPCCTAWFTLVAMCFAFHESVLNCSFCKSPEPVALCHE
eukprot:2107065-Rhodomonas_salina.1